MQITVFGANGKVGRLVVEELLNKGHSVKAFVHSTHNFSYNDKLIIIQGDVYDKQALERAIDGSRAVVSALGSWGTPNKDILTTAISNLIPIMKRREISKIITLTGADSEARGDSNGLVHQFSRPLLKLLAPKILNDGERHIKLLEQSGLDWSVLRSPVMTNLGGPKDYILLDKRPGPWQIINRQSVALALVEMIETDRYSRKLPFISRP